MTPAWTRCHGWMEAAQGVCRILQDNRHAGTAELLQAQFHLQAPQAGNGIGLAWLAPVRHHIHRRQNHQYQLKGPRQEIVQGGFRRGSSSVVRTKMRPPVASPVAE